MGREESTRAEIRELAARPPAKPRSRELGVYAVLIAITFCVYATPLHLLGLRPLNNDPRVQDHFVYLADAWLHGSLSVASPPRGMTEVVRYRGGNYFVYGPMPAVLLLPLVALFGLAASQGLLGAALGAANCAVVFSILGRLRAEPRLRALVTAFFAFGSPHCLAAVWGSTWYFMHVVAVFFMLWAVREALGRGRPLLVGSLVGCAYLTRPMMLLALPFFVMALWPRTTERLRETAKLAFGVVLALAAGCAYNQARFGVLWGNGYQWFKDGGEVFDILALGHVPRNVYAWYFAIPDVVSSFPFLRPNPIGLSLFLGAPAYLALFGAWRKDRVFVASWVTVIAMATGYLTARYTGSAQIVARYSLDFTPFLLPLLVVGLGRLRFPSAVLLVALSIAVEAYGIAWWIFGRLDGPAVFSLTDCLRPLLSP